MPATNGTTKPTKTKKDCDTCKNYACTFYNKFKSPTFTDPCDYAYTDKNVTKQCACPGNDTVLTDDVDVGN